MLLRRLTPYVLKKHSTSAFIYTSTRCSSNVTDKDTSKNITLTIKNRASDLYTKVLEIANLLKTGVVDVTSDFFKLTKLSLSLKGRNRKDGYNYSFDELELLYEFDYEKNRLLPVMCLAILPFGNIIAAPLALKYPKQLLTHHFWTENQKLQFAEIDHKQRVSMYLPVISELHNIDAFEMCPKWRNVLDLVNKGGTPTVDDLKKCVQLFEGEDGPFTFANMSKSLQEKLMCMHNISTLFYKQYRLHVHGVFLMFADYQIRSNGGPNCLMFGRLKRYCFMRGVDAHQMTEKEMQNWLSYWIKFSENFNDNNITLMLCAPALLTLNHRSNASLLFNR